MDSELIDAAKEVLGEFLLSNDGVSAGSAACALLAENGEIYTGICVVAHCGIGFCAEHSAIAEMLKFRQTHVVKIVAVNDQQIMPPCGRCRELINQIDKRNVSTKFLLEGGISKTLDELLPIRFV